MGVYTCQTGSHGFFGRRLNRWHRVISFVSKTFDLVVCFTKLNLNLWRGSVVPIPRVFHKWTLIQIWEARGHFRWFIKLVLFLELPGCRWRCIPGVRGHVEEFVPREQFPLMLEEYSLLALSPLPIFSLHYALFVAQATLHTPFDLLFSNLFKVGCASPLLIFQNLALLHGCLRYLQLLSLDHHCLILTIKTVNSFHKFLLDHRSLPFALFLGVLGVKNLGVLQNRSVKWIVSHLALGLINPRFILVYS
jgi:hypothetical protein